MTAGDFRDRVREFYKGGPTYEHYVNQPLRLEHVERAFVDAYCRRKDISHQHRAACARRRNPCRS